MIRIIPAPKPTAARAETPAAPRKRARETVPVPDALAARAIAFDADLDEALEAAVSRAQLAQEHVCDAFRGTLAEEVARLVEERSKLSRYPADRGSRGRIRVAAQDLAGRAALLGAPLPGRIAASLARLLDGHPAAPRALVLAHLDALAAAVRDGASPDDPVASALLVELERAVSAQRPQAAR